MGLVQDIRAAAVDSRVPIVELLRKCRVLAHVLKNDELKEWVNSELNGYPRDKPVPSYRDLGVVALADIVGVGRNVPVPSSALPPQFRRFATRFEPHHSITALSDMAESGCDSFEFPWPAELANLLRPHLAYGNVPIAVRQVIGRSSVVSIIESVRNRVLEFALTIEENYPDAETVGVPGERAAEVTEAVSTIIYQNYGNVNVAGNNVTQTSSVTVVQGNVDSLHTALEGLGVSQGDFEELQTAIAHDEPITGPDGMGKRVSGWLGKMTMKAASGLLKVGTTTFVSEFVKALMAFHGIKYP